MCTGHAACTELLSPTTHEEVPLWALWHSPVCEMHLEPKTRSEQRGLCCRPRSIPSRKKSVM